MWAIIQFGMYAFVVWSLLQPESSWLVPFVIGGIYLRFWVNDHLKKDAY